MARQPTRRRLTGRLRRNNKRRVSSYRRAMHLSHAQVGFRHLLQNFMVHDGSAARSTLYMLTPLLLLTFIIHNNVTNPTDVNLAATAISFLLRVQYAHHVFKRDRFLRWLRHDQILHDIPLEEEEAAEPHRMPRQDVRFDSWSSQECMDNTSFKKNQLRTIYNHFGLAHLAAQNGGFIRIPTGWFRDYHFHPEELFLFFMTKCKLGISNRLLCDKFFGGHQSRWSFGYPWILYYLDNRYQHQLGNEALHRFVPEFPKFYNAFNKFAKKTSRRHHNDNSSSDRIGLNFIPFRIFGLIDCSIFRINRPFSGPDGDYIGAPRKENYPIAQRAVYTGYKKCHGIKVQTILLPNGISCLYGPTSARVPDIGPTGILEMSGLDHFLQQAQQNNNTPYYAFGDGVYNSNALRRKFVEVSYWVWQYLYHGKGKQA